jgi:hypothetical protein
MIVWRARMLMPWACGIVAMGLWLAPAYALEGDDARWPPFLPARNSVADAALIEHVWAHVTFQRTLSGPPIDVPLPLYAALIDAPDVLAAAATRLGLASETAERRTDGTYEFRGPKGSSAVYRVLVSEPERRVVLSHGYLVVWGVQVAGAVLGILAIEAGEAGVRQQLTVHARVENTVWALLAKVLVAILPSVADEQLSRGFRIAGAVATWARRDRDEFCAWLDRSRLDAPRVASAAGCADDR